jgi:hypothetical protein
MKYWEIIADNLKNAVGATVTSQRLDSNGRTIWIVDAHRDGKRFVVHADEKLSASPRFLQLESASWLFEIANVLVRFDHVASVIVNPNHSIM